MKKTISIISTVLFVCNSMAATIEGTEEFDRSTAELTAKLLLEKLQDDVLSAEPDSELLFRMMETDPAPYVEPSEARNKLETTFREGIETRYKTEAIKYLDRLAGDAGRTAVFGEAFLFNAVELPEDRLQNTVKSTYPNAFTAARTKVCKEQSERLSADIKPTEKEFEDISRADLADIMTERVAKAQNKPVFRENLAYITGSIVTPMLDAAEAQRNEQRARLNNLPVEGWTPETIGKALEAGIANFVAESAPRHREAGRVAYGVFPSVTAAVPGAAANRAVGRVTRVVEGSEIKIDSDEILREIENNPEAHRKMEESMKTFTPALERKLGEDTISKCEQLMPAEERVEFRAFAEKSMNEGRIREAVQKCVANVLLPEVKTIRDEFANRQVEDNFKPVVSGTWFPSGELVDHVYAQTDYRKAVKGWKEFEELADFAAIVRTLPLMEESEKKLDEGIGVLFDRGRMAQSRQHGIVDEVFTEMKELFSAEKEIPDIETATGRYTEKVSTVWTGERDSVLWGEPDSPRPSNAAEQHVELFPSTEEKILLKVKSLMESIEKERQEKESIEQIPEEETPPDEISEEDSITPPEEIELVELDCRFVFDRGSSDITIDFYVDENKKSSLKCSYTPKRYRSEYEDTVARIVDDLLKEINTHTYRGSEVALEVAIIVRDDLVYYGIVEKLANTLTQKAVELSDRGVSMSVKESVLE